MSFKRNQVEQAITIILAQTGVETASEVRVRLKRLLDTDRTLDDGMTSSPAAATFAFYSGSPPGRGVEVSFTSYDAFALLLGTLLMWHRWPQATAVRIMRQARPMLEAEHARILKLDPGELFDPEERRRQMSPGAPALESSSPVFLAIASAGSQAQGRGDTRAMGVSVCAGEVELMQFRREHVPPGMGMTVLELTAPAHLLAHHLERTEPKPRGRSRR
jgi:hypothetical protein